MGGQKFFDPSEIVADCSAGNGKVSSSAGWQRVKDWGGYSWGGNPNEYKGYTQQESKKLKDQAIKDAEDATKKFDDLSAKADKAEADLAAAKKTGDAAKIADAEMKYDAAYQAAKNQAEEVIDADAKAREDPNQKPPPATHPVAGGESECQNALETAREILLECNRNGWKSADCRQLLAKMNGCADPSTILVDPDQGYVCGAKIDTDALKAAWIAQCETRKKFGPEGNPCVAPQIDKSGHFGKGLIFDICNDPHAYIDPYSNECRARVTVARPFGEPDIQQLIVWGLNKFGGPIIILPRNPPSPEPQPRPQPNAGPQPNSGPAPGSGAPPGVPGPLDLPATRLQIRKQMAKARKQKIKKANKNKNNRVRHAMHAMPRAPFTT